MASEAYATTTGWATVTSVRTPDPHAYNLQDAVEVVFDFEPDQSRARDHEAVPGPKDRGRLLTVGGGANPPRRWALRMGLTPGSRHRCLRRELTRGVGTPVVFEFPDVDDTALAAAFEEGGS